VTDDFRASERASDLTIVDAAMRFAQQISKALRATRGRLPDDEAERAAILREAFECTIGAVSHDGTGDPTDAGAAAAR
jgi:hypothetical protein